MFPDFMASIAYSSTDQFANILTKGLFISLFQHHCSNLMLGSSKPEIEGHVKISTVLCLPSVRRLKINIVRMLLVLFVS